MKARYVIGGILVFAAALMTYTMFNLGQIECTLCVSYQDQRKCSKAMGPDKASAMEEAHRNACALMVSGVTDSVNCGRALAEDVQCQAPAN